MMDRGEERMIHCLAYGNSDQVSFRDSEVRECFDILTVPSTIASYYPDATAAFVLSSGLEYMIEPRTPLFQEWIREPRASHRTLAKVLGAAVNQRLQSVEKGSSVHYPAEFYTQAVCEEVVSGLVQFQCEYGRRAEQVSARLSRYRDLLSLATGGSRTLRTIDETRPPTYVLCPYFAVNSYADRWWQVMLQIWYSARQHSQSDNISPVVATTDVSCLTELVHHCPNEMSSTVFFWIPGFDERRVSQWELTLLREAVEQLGSSYDLMNLYGGYFSILLGKLGLAGFNNGLGYSESREWPTLDATGAAPARYYVRKLHAYLPTASATTLVENDPTFGCNCSVCGEDDRLPNDLSYHELKRHFALARSWEQDHVDATSLDELSDEMRADGARIEALMRRMPGEFRMSWDYLARWARVLSS